MKLQFKTPLIEQQWAVAVKAGLPIVKIVEYFVELSINDLKKEPIMTCFLRTQAEEDALYPNQKGKVSLHDPLYKRAADMRTKMYTDEEIQYLKDKINERFEYDPTRPGKFQCALAHKIDTSAYHFHLQCHPRTAETP